MIEVQAWLMGGEMDAWMVMQVQDQRGFEVKEAQVDDFIEEVKARMQGAAELDVALTVEAESGANWDEAH